MTEANIIKSAVETAKLLKLLANSEGSDMLNMAFLIKKGLKTGMMPMDFRDERTKFVWILSMKSLLYHEKADAILMVNDAWYVKAAKTANVDEIRPSKHPDKQQCICVVYQNNKHKEVQAMLPYYIKESEVIWEDEEVNLKLKEQTPGGNLSEMFNISDEVKKLPVDKLVMKKSLNLDQLEKLELIENN